MVTSNQISRDVPHGERFLYYIYSILNLFLILKIGCDRSEVNQQLPLSSLANIFRETFSDNGV